jgi:uncharacterized protein with HEPN domain
LKKFQLTQTIIPFDNFINDEKTIDAVVRNFEIIGKASKLISE